MARYFRSMELLYDAIRFSNRAYLFDNSGAPSDQLLIAEFVDGIPVRISQRVPEWFLKYVVSKAEG